MNVNSVIAFQPAEDSFDGKTFAIIMTGIMIMIISYVWCIDAVRRGAFFRRKIQIINASALIIVALFAGFLLITSQRLTCVGASIYVIFASLVVVYNLQVSVLSHFRGITYKIVNVIVIGSLLCYLYMVALNNYDCHQ